MASTPQISSRTKVVTLVVIIAFALLFLVLPSMLYVVEQRELAVVLQFGKPVVERTEPGIYVKTPWIQNVRKLPATRQFWGGDMRDVLPDLPTKDGKKVDVMPWAVWRIKEPIVFVQTLRQVDNAEQRVAQFVRGAIRDVITQYDLSELVRSTDRELTYSFTPQRMLQKVQTTQAQVQPSEAKQVIQHGRPKILAQIKEEAMRRLATDTSVQAGVDTAATQGGQPGTRGIELVDVGIAQIDFVPKVREAAFERLVAFMESIAALYENEGEREKQEIINRTEAEVEKIEGEGKQQANEIRGQADAEIIAEYAKAITETGEFYTFVRTLEAYKLAMQSDTTLVLTTDSSFFNLLKELSKAPPLSTTKPNK